MMTLNPKSFVVVAVRECQEVLATNESRHGSHLAFPHNARLRQRPDSEPVLIPGDQKLAVAAEPHLDRIVLVPGKRRHRRPVPAPQLEHPVPATPGQPFPVGAELQKERILLRSLGKCGRSTPERSHGELARPAIVDELHDLPSLRIVQEVPEFFIRPGVHPPFTSRASVYK